MKKIAFFSTFPLEYYGGFEKRMIETAGSIESNWSNEFEISIINLNKNWYEKFCKIISLSHIFKLTPTYRISQLEKDNNLGNIKNIQCSFSELNNLLNQYDVIYVKGEILELSILKIIKFKQSIKIIAGFHTSPFYRHTFGLSSRIHNILYSKLILSFLTKKIHIFHVLNDAQKEYLSKIKGYEYIKKIYNPFDFLNFISQAQTNKFALNLDSSKITITRIGRFSQEKGVDRLLEMILISKDKYNWVIVGDGQLFDDFSLKVSHLKNISLLGQINNKFISSILEQSDVLLSTSYTECFPYNILEGIAHRLYIVAYENDGINELLKNYGKKKIVISPDDILLISKQGFRSIGSLDNINNKILNLPDIYHKLFKLFKE